MKTYLFVFRDHSGSMGHIVSAAERDYNRMLTDCQVASVENDIQTILSVYEVGGGYSRAETLIPIEFAQPMPPGSYRAPGHNTPLFNAMEEAVQVARQLPDANDQETVFQFAVITDGQDNVTGSAGGQRVAAKIKELQKTDRWTFAFRVPKGDKKALVKMGLDAGNILEWDTSEHGMETSSEQHSAAQKNFYSELKRGVKSTRTFYTSAADLTEAQVKATLGDISASVQLLPISAAEDGMQIRDFVEKRLRGVPMSKGAAFYQLVKTEDKIQDYKLIAIRDKDTGEIYCGPEARQLIGLPAYGDARVRPDTGGKWHVFVQSTSVNRKVSAGTQLLYWPDVGVRFKEGKSAR
jgi:hypothetical protein